MPAIPPRMTTGRPLRVRRRLDLRAVPQTLRGRTVWAIKDPLAQAYYHLTEESYWLLTHLDGLQTIDQLRREFEQQFVPQKLPVRELEQALVRFHRQGLVVADSPGQDGQLLKRASEEHRSRVWSQLWNPLAIRLPGVDPDRCLRFLQPASQWLWSSSGLILGLLWIGSALFLALSGADELPRRVADGSRHLAAGWFWLLPLALACSKILHELGHGLLCRQLGAECREMGVLLLMFTPCLYCNVSDAWMLPSKWLRAAVGLAGIYVDLLLAATAMWIWWFSQPGLVHAVAGSLLVVCSLATIVFNANPLLRYDGYHVLADLVEVPNLGQRADATLRDWIGWLFVPHWRHQEEFSVAGQLALVAYSVAAFVWRVALVVGIAWLFAGWLSQIGLEVLAGGIAVLLLGGVVAQPAAGAWRLLTENPQPPGQHNSRGWVVGCGLALAMAGLLFVPWPYRLRVPAMIEPAGAASVYVAVSGRLLEAVPPGTRVSAGDVLARLENLDLRLETARLETEIVRQQTRLANLKRRQGRDRVAAAAIPTAEELLTGLKETLAQRRMEQERLTLRAPHSGIVWPPPEREASTRPGELAPWRGTVLDRQNIETVLETGTLFCEVGPEGEYEVKLLVNQSLVEFVAPGQSVDVLLDQAPWRTLPGRIVELSQAELSDLPPPLARHADLTTEVDERGQMRPLQTLYQARVQLSHTAGLSLIPRQTGRGRIHAGGRSLFSRGTRFIAETFGLEAWRNVVR